MSRASVRVLHVLGSLECGGVEKWVAQLLKHLDNRRVQADVMVNRSGGMYEGDVRSCGAEVLCCGQPRSYAQYATNLSRLLFEHGPYQVVHSHVQLWSGVVLRLAHQAGVPGRIAHARSTQDGRRGRRSPLIYQTIMRYWIKRHATHLMAVSTKAAEGTFWKGIVNKDGCQVVTGIDFTPFKEKVDREAVRAELGIPREARVIGHVGNFRPAKNYPFILEAAQKIVSIWPDSLLLLVGDGPLRSQVEESAQRLGLADRIHFLGERADVPRLLHAMDVFVFPSLYEGFGRALVEAQAAGLPCVAADTIPIETAAHPGSVNFLPLKAGAKEWAQAILTAAQTPISSTRGGEAVRSFEQRGLDIAANAQRLSDLYEVIAGTAK
jgi:glycosyltransferase involved in cell wall biosynthesis